MRLRIAFLEHPTKPFIFLQDIIAFICFALPIILRVCDHDVFYPARVNHVAISNISGTGTTVRIDSTEIKYCSGKDSQLILKNDNLNETIVSNTIIKKDQFGFRSSISHYAHSTNSYLYGMLYCMAAMLFIYNGVFYIKNVRNTGSAFEKINENGTWYNILIGICLILIILNPLHDREILHYIFAFSFFIGNILIIAFCKNPGETGGIRYFIVVLAAIPIIMSLLKIIPVLWGEWASLIVIAFHSFLVAKYVKKEYATQNRI